MEGATTIDYSESAQDRLKRRIGAGCREADGDRCYHADLIVSFEEDVAPIGRGLSYKRSGDLRL
jgi:hypothetical protein